MTQTALARAAGTSQAAVARYEAGLTEPGLATLERLVGACGRRLTVSTAPRFPGPRGRTLERMRPQVLEACARHGARGAQVFGSVARGEDRPDSDIDLLVELDEGRTLLDLEELQIELAEILDVAVDIGTTGTLRGGVSEAVRRDLVRL